MLTNVRQGRNRKCQCNELRLYRETETLNNVKGFCTPVNQVLSGSSRQWPSPDAASRIFLRLTWVCEIWAQLFQRKAAVTLCTSSDLPCFNCLHSSLLKFGSIPIFLDQLHDYTVCQCGEFGDLVTAHLQCSLWKTSEPQWEHQIRQRTCALNRKICFHGWASSEVHLRCLRRLLSNWAKRKEWIDTRWGLGNRRLSWAQSAAD